MARLRARIKTETNGKQQGMTTRLGEQQAEASVNSLRPGHQKEAKTEVVTNATVRMFEDGSGTFQLRRGPENITIRWTEEEAPVFELYADFNGIEGALTPSIQPVEVPEGANDN